MSADQPTARELGETITGALREGAKTTSPARAREVLRALVARCEQAERDYADAQRVITEQHGKLWLVGLDNHDREEPQTVEQSVSNLRSLLSKSFDPTADGPQ